MSNMLGRCMASAGLLRASLALNFLSGALDSRLSFSRTTNAWYTNAAGVITQAAINEPRFDYDPVTLVPRGLLLEEGRTNLALQADTLSTQNITAAAIAYTLSFYGAGTVSLSGVATGSLVGAGTYPARSTLTFTPTAGTLTLTITGSVRFAQIEAGAFATSYIPTFASAVSRGFDRCVMDTALLTTASLSVVFAGDISNATSNYEEVLSIGVGAASDNLILSRYPSNSFRQEVKAAGVQGAATNGGVFTPGVKFGLASRFERNNVSTSRDGSAATAPDTSCDIPTGLTKIGFFNSYGREGTFTGPAITGHIRSLTIYPTALPDATLQQLSAL